MFPIEHYLVNAKTIFLATHFGEYGEKHSQILEDVSAFVAKKSPQEVINFSIPLGYDMKGASKNAKRILGWRNMPPIIVNPYQKICLVPFGSPTKGEDLWINVEKVLHTIKDGKKTKVIFKNGFAIHVNYTIKTTNNKLQDGFQLLNLAAANGLRESYQEPIIIPQNGDGSYNLDVFENEMQNTTSFSRLIENTNEVFIG